MGAGARSANPGSGLAPAHAASTGLQRLAPVALARRPRTHDASPAGPDIGWALACAGLLLAAAIIGLTADGRQATARGGSRLAGALRPLVGRR